MQINELLKPESFRGLVVADHLMPPPDATDPAQSEHDLLGHLSESPLLYLRSRNNKPPSWPLGGCEGHLSWWRWPCSGSWKCWVEIQGAPCLLLLLSCLNCEWPQWREISPALCYFPKSGSEKQDARGHVAVKVWITTVPALPACQNTEED